jgi:predicted amidohydrolase YtcJ
MKALDAVPASSPRTLNYNSDKFTFYGEDLMKRAMAFRTLLDAGIRAAGSDFNLGPFDPRMAIQGMVTRTGWDGKTWGAYNAHEENIKGRSRPASSRITS